CWRPTTLCASLTNSARPASAPPPLPLRGGSSLSASSPLTRRRVTVTSAPGRSSMAHPRARSRRSWRSRMPPLPRITWRKGTWGTGATSCFTPRPCSARSSASSRRWPRPPRRRLAASRATSIFCAWQANPSHARPRNRLIMPSCSAAVVPVDLGWSDIGSWSTVWDVLDHDAAGNATDGPVVMLDSRNSLARSEEPVLTTVVGLDDVIVVSTADAVLVSARAKAEQVKTLVEQLKAHNHRAAVEHRRVYRPWGYYQDVDIAPRYKVKRIVVKPGSKLSLQKHFHRSEHWVVVKGTAEVTLGNDVRSVHENESIYIPIGSIHRLANP